MGDIADWMIDQAIEEEAYLWEAPYRRRYNKKRKKSMKVRGIAYWASIQSPNTTFEPVYTIDLAVDEAAADALKAHGLKAKSTEDGLIVKFKRKQFKADGSENKRPVIRDAANQPFDELIGNGSEVIVQFNTYEWKNKFGSGIAADLQGVQVVELVPYRQGDGDEFAPIGEEEEEVIGSVPPAKPKKADAEFDDDIPDVL